MSQSDESQTFNRKASLQGIQIRSIAELRQNRQGGFLQRRDTVGMDKKHSNGL